jgi:hypothetical protein
MIGKNITAHCLKVTAITLGYKMTKDIELCRQLGGHASIATTGIYLREEKDYTKQLSYNMGRRFTGSILDYMSVDEVIKVIEENDEIKNSIIMRKNFQ